MIEIINQRYMNFLFNISNKERNISELAKKGDLTLSVASTLITRWNRCGLVDKTKVDGQRGKEIIITLTEYGKKQVKLLRELNKNYKIKKEEITKQQKEIEDISNNKLNTRRVKKENKSSLASSLDPRSKAEEENTSKDIMSVNADNQPTETQNKEKEVKNAEQN